MMPIFMFLTARGVSAGAARLLSYIIPAIVVILLVAGIAGGIKSCVADKVDTAVKLDQANVNAEANARVSEADRAVMANQIAEAATIANQQAESRHEAESKGNDDRVGPGTAAVLDSVRRQQNAGRH